MQYLNSRQHIIVPNAKSSLHFKITELQEKRHKTYNIQVCIQVSHGHGRSETSGEPQKLKS